MIESPKVSFFGLASWLGLLIVECESLLVQHYEVRTELRRVVGIPLYHMLLTFVALALLAKFFGERSRTSPVDRRWHPGWLVSHLVSYFFLQGYFERWWWAGKQQSAILLLFLGVSALFSLSWLLAWLPLSAQRSLLIEELSWVKWAVPLSVATPYLSEFASSGWESFADVTLSLTRGCLEFLYDPVYCQKETRWLGTESFLIQILPGCSGYEGMGLMAVLVTAYFILCRKRLRFPQALCLLPIAVVLAYLGNILRLVVLIVIGTEISESIALRGFHSQAGWLSFSVLGITLIGLVEKGHLFSDASQQPQAETDLSYPALPYLMPLAALIFSTMLIQATTGKFAYAYPLKPLLSLIVLCCYFRQYARLWLRPVWLSPVLGVGVAMMWRALMSDSECAVSPFEALSQPLAVVWILFRMFGSVVIVPVVEELAFRGYLMRRLQSEDFESKQGPTPLWILLITSVLFGLVHQELLAGTLAGIAYGWVATRRGGLVNAVVAHAVTNFCLSVEAVGFGHWGVW